jgi:hypothetical protein
MARSDRSKDDSAPPHDGPELSVILITPDRYATLRPLVRSLMGQTCREKIELVFVSPAGDSLDVVEADLDGFLSVEFVRIDTRGSSAKARAAGILAAAAPVVAFTEDHCFPGAHWAESLIARHREPWSGIGPVFRNANPRSGVSWANFLIEYGDWADPIATRFPSHIPGHNSSYKKEALLPYGPELEKRLEAETPMQWDLQSRGHRFCMEEGAKVSHLNYSRLFDSVALRLNVGRLFACRRSDGWPVWKRWMFVLASPAIPVVRFFRIAPIAGRTIRSAWLACRVLPLLLLMLIVDGLGEAVGYLTGSPGDAMRILSDGEFHRHRHLNEADQRLADARDSQYEEAA